MKEDPNNLNFSGYDFDPEFALAQKRRMLAQLLEQSVTQAKHGTIKRHPLAWVADFMTAKGAKAQGAAAEAQQLALLKQHQAAEDSGMQDLQGALTSNDPRQVQEALAKALTSRYGRVSGLAKDTQKNRMDVFEKTISALKDRVNPESVLASAPTANLGGVTPNPPLKPPMLMSQLDSTGKPRSWVQTQDNKGEYGVHTLSDPTQINNNMGPKTGFEVLEQQGKHFAAGGKGYEEAQATQSRMASTSNMLKTLAQNPTMGAGGNAFQIARKWAETLGMGPIELTGNTEQMKMQLKAHVLQALGGKLGNQISDADRNFIEDAIGSLETDPGALRRLLLVGLKNDMLNITKQYSQANALEQNPAFQAAGIQLPGYAFGPQSGNAPELNDADAADFEQIMAGRMPKLRKPSMLPSTSRIRPR
jgi:hypothetical protein